MFPMWKNDNWWWDNSSGSQNIPQLLFQLCGKQLSTMFPCSEFWLCRFVMGQFQNNSHSQIKRMMLSASTATSRVEDDIKDLKYMLSFTKESRGIKAINQTFVYLEASLRFFRSRLFIINRQWYSKESKSDSDYSRWCSMFKIRTFSIIVF